MGEPDSVGNIVRCQLWRIQTRMSRTLMWGCQKAIAANIKVGKGEFVIGVKGNQPKLLATIESFFDDHWDNGDWSKGRCKRFHTIEQTGGCQEDRSYYVATLPKRAVVFGNWPSVTAIGMVISVRQKGDEVTEEVRYYILSEYLNGDQFAKAVRQHWSVENNCHWQLDVLFREDDSRVRERTLANNLSWLRRVAITLLKHHPATDSIKGKQQQAAWNQTSLAQVLRFPEPNFAPPSVYRGRGPRLPRRIADGCV